MIPAQEKNDKKGWGVIVGRFQSPYLHEGHKNLFEHVFAKHDKFMVFIGLFSGQPNPDNPMDFETRKKMVEETYPDRKFIILPIANQKSDEVWSRNLDKSIGEINKHSDVKLYGGRDSFIAKYTGHYKTENVESKVFFSATAIREKVSDSGGSSEEFRRGVIHGVSNRFPSPYLTVDIAPLNTGRKEVLVGKKLHEKHVRFIGGFVDSADPSITAAAKRETHEETGGKMELSNFKLIGEAKIDDWRYRSAREQIFTNFFTCEHSFGTPTPSDDIEYVEWVPYAKIRETVFEPEHEVLKQMLLKELNLPMA